VAADFFARLAAPMGPHAIVVILKPTLTHSYTDTKGATQRSKISDLYRHTIVSTFIKVKDFDYSLPYSASRLYLLVSFTVSPSTSRPDMGYWVTTAGKVISG
jgi:hypothetical protein